MAFVQIIDFHTDRMDEGAGYVEEYELMLTSLEPIT